MGKFYADDVPRKRKSVAFTENPLDFNPIGLVARPKPGTKNGGLIIWLDANKKAVFRWDQDLDHSPHYHIENDPVYIGKHFEPGVHEVPEPYASIYFGGV